MQPAAPEPRAAEARQAARGRLCPGLPLPRHRGHPDPPGELGEGGSPPSQESKAPGATWREDSTRKCLFNVNVCFYIPEGKVTLPE